MKHILSFATAVTAMVAMSCQSAPADSYTITGSIPGIADSTMVVLVNHESGRSQKDTVYTQNGKFVIEGSIENPALAEIRIENRDGMGKAFSMMLENANIEIYAPALDSIPSSWYADPQEKMLEKCLKIKGGKAQSEYQEYCDAMFPFELAAKSAHYKLYWADDKRERSAEDEAECKKALADADIALAAAKNKFVDEHPTYNISLKILDENLGTPFSFTNEQLDEVLAKTEASEWVAGRDSLAKAVERYREVVSMCPFRDINLLTQKGDTVALNEYAGKGNYVFIDFWASWCGPCRAAIPHVKELYAEYPEGLTIISVSVDKEKSDWERAMKEENMAWTQLWAPDELGSQASEAYCFRAIPTLVVIDPEGRIALETNDPNAVSTYLTANLSKAE